MTHEGFEDLDYVHGTIKPKNDNVLVRLDKPSEELVNGIVRVSTEPRTIDGVWATVVAVGSGPAYKRKCRACQRPLEAFEMGLAPGDRVILETPTAGEIIQRDGGEHRMVR